jgi:hypothetical protein
MDDYKAVYPIGIVAELLNIHEVAQVPAQAYPRGRPQYCRHQKTLDPCHLLGNSSMLRGGAHKLPGGA